MSKHEAEDHWQSIGDIAARIVKRLEQNGGLMLTLEARLRQRASRMRRHKANDFQLRDVPLGDLYVLNTGSVDRYLERLREVYGDHEQRSGNDPRSAS